MTHTTNVPGPDELREMSAEEAMLAGAEADGVHIVHRRQRFPVPGTKAEKRAELAVSFMFGLAALAGIAFIVVFVAWPYRYESPGQGSQAFRFYTPLLGGLLGVLLIGLGLGAVLWAKWLMPEEEVIQDRHDEPSPEEEKLMTAATLSVGLSDTGLQRRKMLLGTLVISGGALLTVPLVALVGAMIKKPGNKLAHTLWGQSPAQYPNGVPMIYGDGRRVSPNDIQPGGLATVFPGVPGGVTSANTPTLLIRLRPNQTVKSRKGQAGFGWEDYVAYSKICTHAGCPASLYEQQTTRLLCPCHQSQFEVLQDAKPVFGPATRPLPKLPLGIEVVNGRQFFVATRDFVEPIGPAYWERP